MHKNRLLLCATAMLVFGLQPGIAAEEGGTLAVSVSVPTELTLSVEGHPDRLVVGSAAVVKQQLDYDAILTVQSNNPDGFNLAVVATAEPYYRWVELIIEAKHYLLLPGGHIHIPVSYRESETWVHQLRYRFILSAEANTGQHPWPLEVSVVPL